MESDSFITKIVGLSVGTEMPAVHCRWAAITALGAALERSISFPFGGTKIYPNTYCILVGSPGVRKSTVKNLASSILRKSGYNKFSGDATSKEKFLVDLDEGAFDEFNLDSSLDFASSETDCRSVLIAVDEIDEFLGYDPLDFAKTIGTLWDYSGLYRKRLKSKSVSIPNPTLSLLAASTPTTLARIFPESTFGQGFFSRVVFVYSEPKAVKVTFPVAPNQAVISSLLDDLDRIKTLYFGDISMTEGAEKLIDLIYRSQPPASDVRLQYYMTRRLTHLIKLILVVTASNKRERITVDDVVEANTYLHAAEQSMPKVFGEFGAAKLANTASKVVAILTACPTGKTSAELWKEVHQDVDSISKFVELLNSLEHADKLVRSNGVYLLKRQARHKVEPGTIDLNYLTKDEIHEANLGA